MQISIFLAGALIVLITAYDFFYTTLSASGAAFITHRTTHAFWSFFLFSSKVFHSKKILKGAGGFILLCTLLLWLILLWAGLFLMLISDERSVVTSSKELTSGLVDKLYYSGYLLSTLGLGDYKPEGKLWQMLTSIFSFTGFIFITTAISYFVSVSSAIISKRTLSLTISNLGSSPQVILSNSWNGKDFSRLIRYVPSLQQQINQHTQSHMAYPVLHFFHTAGKKDSIAINLTNLDEALSILLLSNDGQSPNNQEDLNSLRDAIDFYLNTLKQSFIQPLNQQHPVPDLSPLKMYEIHFTDDQKVIKEKFSQLQERRSLLAGLLKNDGWSWKDIYELNTERA